MEFKPWGKTPRLYRDIVISEKIDGTQAVIGISDDEFVVGSRNQWLTDDVPDHYYLREWALEREGLLRSDLGNGIHNGEWFGYKVNRGYGLKERQLALFNTEKYEGVEFNTPGLTTVPTLYKGVFDESRIKWSLDVLRSEGSLISPGFMRPEGVCIYHSQSNQVFKVLLEKDHLHKGQL